MTHARTRSREIPSPFEVVPRTPGEPWVGRPTLAEVVDRVDRLLARGEARPVLVGPPGVGKSEVIYGWLSRRAPRGSRPRPVWSLSLRRVGALATRDHGPGALLGDLLGVAAQHPDQPVVWIPDLWALRRAEAEQDFAAVLAETGVSVIAEAWPSILRWCDEAPELSQVLHPIAVPEPDERELRAMLQAQAVAVASEYDVRVTTQAVERAQDLARRWFPTVSGAGAAVQLLVETARETPTGGTVRAADVSERLVESSSLPATLVSPDASLPARVAEAVTAQRPDLVEVARALEEVTARWLADLNDPRRPMGVLLFAGPIGAGKRAVAQAVCEVLGGARHQMIRVSLPEIGDEWPVDALFGRRGAEGEELRRGILSHRLAGRRFAVLLIEGLESARTDAVRALLRPLDEGGWVDGNDDEVSLRNVLVILTAAVGDDALHPVGFTESRGDEHRAGSLRRRLEETLPPEVLLAVERALVIPTPDAAAARALAVRETTALRDHPRLAEVGARLVVPEAVIDAVIAEAASGSAGLSSLRRAFHRRVSAPVARALLNHRKLRGQTLTVGVDGEVELTPREEPVEP